MENITDPFVRGFVNSITGEVTIGRIVGRSFPVTTTDKSELNSAKVHVEYDRVKKQIFARDLTDTNNEPACYTKTKRGLDKVWGILVELSKLGPDFPLTHRDVMDACTQAGVRYHYWCMVD